MIGPVTQSLEIRTMLSLLLSPLVVAAGTVDGNIDITNATTFQSSNFNDTNTTEAFPFCNETTVEGNYTGMVMNISSNQTFPRGAGAENQTKHTWDQFQDVDFSDYFLTTTSSPSPTVAPTASPTVSPTASTPLPTTALPTPFPTPFTTVSTPVPTTVSPTVSPTTSPTVSPTESPQETRVPTFPPTLRSKNVRILPLGDSITSNGFGHLSYRYFLWRSMLDATPTTEKWNDFDFIGHLRDGEYGNPEWPPVNGQSFDRDHEGHWGWTTDAVLGQLDFWLGGLNAALECCSGFRIPDIALVHLGTNDCINGENVNAILAELNQVVSILHDHNPGMHVFIAKVIPANDANIQPCLDELNGNMDDFFASVTSGRVTVVDMASGFNVVTDLWDNLHPNAQGSEKMANRWFDAIMANY